MHEINLNNFYDIQESLSRSGIIFIYNGPMSQKTLIEVAQLIRSNLKSDEVVQGSIQRIFAVFIEQAQNILKYSADREKTQEGAEAGIGIISILKKQKYYVIQSGNIVQNNRRKILEEKLNHLVTLSAEDLKQFYRETKREARKISGIESAGLGLIDVARKADRPLEWYFKTLNGETSFFTLRVFIEHTADPSSSTGSKTTWVTRPH